MVILGFFGLISIYNHAVTTYKNCDGSNEVSEPLFLLFFAFSYIFLFSSKKSLIQTSQRDGSNGESHVLCICIAYNYPQILPFI